MSHRTEIESLFLSDIKEKKKEFSSLKSSQKGKRVGKNKILFPSDFMSRKEKIKHMGAGAIVTTNLFDKILTFAEYAALETHEKRNMLQYWRNKYSNKKIMEEMGIANKKFYDLVEELGLPKMERKKRTSTPLKGKTKPVAIQSSLELEAAPAAAVIAPIQEVIVNGLQIGFNGTHKAEKIQQQLTKIIGLLEGESDQFYVELKLMQKAAK